MTVCGVFSLLFPRLLQVRNDNTEAAAKKISAAAIKKKGLRDDISVLVIDLLPQLADVRPPALLQVWFSTVVARFEDCGAQEFGNRCDATGAWWNAGLAYADGGCQAGRAALHVVAAPSSFQPKRNCSCKHC